MHLEAEQSFQNTQQVNELREDRNLPHEEDPEVGDATNFVDKGSGCLCRTGFCGSITEAIIARVEGEMR